MDLKVWTNENEGSTVNFTERTDSGFPGIKFIDIDIEFKEYANPKKIVIAWYMPIIDAYGLQDFGVMYDRNNPPSWHPRVNYFSGNRYAPFQQLVSSDGRNSLTLTLSDATTYSNIKCGVEEPFAAEEIILDLFNCPCPKMKDYHVTVYIDDNDKPYDEAVTSVLRFWEEKCGYKYAFTPDDAREPLYSAWYSFHRDQYADKIVEQCKMAVKYGMKVVIVDDGWELAENNHGFQSGGDWEPYLPKVHDMKEFARRVHETGMKIMVWFSPAHCGPYTKAYQRFKDMLVNPDSGEDPVFDPRYPEVRKYLEERIADQAIEWDLDGFKLDFIDAMFPGKTTPPINDRMDFDSVYDAVDALLKAITDKVRAFKPDFLIEFRQAYFGPAIRQYGNMLRVSDCPDDSMRNHVAGIWMRQTVGPQSVHSDMLMWHNDDPVESVANQFLCCMYLVPQISMRLDELNEEHKLALKTFLDFWTEHKDTLLFGKLTADNPTRNYTLVKAEKDGEIIAVAHAKPVLTVDDFDKLYLFNASDENKLIVFAEKDFKEVCITITDCCGRTVSEKKYSLTKGAHIFDVPKSGMLRINR